MASLMADVHLLDNITQERAATVVNQRLPGDTNAHLTVTGGKGLSGRYNLAKFVDLQTGSYVQQSAPVSIMINWWFDMGAASSDRNPLVSTLAHASDLLNFSLAIRREIKPWLASVGFQSDDEDPLGDQAAEYATCSRTLSALSGKLRHKTIDLAKARAPTRQQNNTLSEKP